MFRQETYKFHISRQDVINDCLHDLQVHGWILDKISYERSTQMAILSFITNKSNNANI